MGTFHILDLVGHDKSSEVVHYTLSAKPVLAGLKHVCTVIQLTLERDLIFVADGAVIRRSLLID